MNIIEISQKFPLELDAIKHFEFIRWGKIIKCPFCKSKNLGVRNKDYRWHCKTCQKSFSVTSGTKLQGSRIPLKTWLYAFAIVTDAKKGVSAKQLERNLGVTYETAWNMYHKIREMMHVENKTVQLNDVTEIDTTFIGGKPRKFQYEKKGTPEIIPELDQIKEKYEAKGFEFEEGKYKKPAKIGKQKRGKGVVEYKETVAGIVERGGDVVAEVIRKTNFSELKKIIDKHVQKNETVLLMDKDTSNIKLGKIIDNIVIDHSKMYSYSGLNTNSIESFWAIIKRQIIGQHHHVSPKLLNNYVQEVVFKYNNRNTDDMFETLIKISMS